MRKKSNNLASFKNEPWNHLATLHLGIFFHQIGLGYENSIETDSSNSVYELDTLENIIKNNGDEGRMINFLKVDIEGDELESVPQWLKSNILENIQQIQMEVHTTEKHIKTQEGITTVFNFLESVKIMSEKFGFHIIDHSPNPCMYKELNSKGERYDTNFDIVLYKPKKE